MFHAERQLDSFGRGYQTGRDRGCFVVHWPPILPWGYPDKVPETAQEIYDAYAPGIDYAANNNLVTYVPCFHPWSIYRIDQHVLQIELLLTHAQQRMNVVSCTELYTILSQHHK